MKGNMGITMEGYFVYGYKHRFMGVENVVDALKNNFPIDLNEVDLDGRSLLMYACNRLDTEMISLLLDNDVDVNLIDRYGNSALTYACKKGYSRTVDILLQKGAKVREELIIASEMGYYSTVETILKYDVDVNAVNKYGETALICVCGVNTPRRKEIIECLLAHGADVNIQSNEKATALMVACFNQNLDAVEMLLEHKANIAVKAINDKSVVMYACDTKNDAIITSLLKEYIHIEEPTIKDYCKTIQKDLVDLYIARKDYSYIKNSVWFNDIRQVYANLKRKIKETTLCENDKKIELLIEENKNYKNLNIDEARRKLLKDSKQDLKKVEEILNQVEHFGSRVELGRKDYILKGIKIYKDRAKEIEKTM